MKKPRKVVTTKQRIQNLLTGLSEESAEKVLKILLDVLRETGVDGEYYDRWEARESTHGLLN